jgi:hypothetical protein
MDVANGNHSVRHAMVSPTGKWDEAVLVCFIEMAMDRLVDILTAGATSELN